MSPNLEVIWNEFSEQLGRFIRARVQDPAAAEDIRQEVFLKIQSRLGQLRDLSRLESWLYQVTRNAIADHYRTRPDTAPLPDTMPGEGAPPGGESDMEGLRAAFGRMIQSLPEPYRAAVVLTELEGVTQKELARRLGLSLSGAKSRVQRGRALLKKDLLECCRFEFDRRGGMVECEPKSRKSCPECS